MQQYSIVGLGKELEKYGLRVGENPAFGSGKVGKHAPNSHHYYGEAIDVTDWRPGEWQQRTKGLSQRAKQLGLFTEALGPGDPGHDTHVHLALRNNVQMTPQQVEWLATGRYKNQQGSLIDTMPVMQQTTQTTAPSVDQEELAQMVLRQKQQEADEFLSDFLTKRSKKTEPVTPSIDAVGMLKQAFQAPTFMS
jgi:hypothetical protein